MRPRSSTAPETPVTAARIPTAPTPAELPPMPIEPAWILEGARAQQSLISLGVHQLGEKLARTVKSDALTTMGVVDADQTALV